VIWYKYTTPSGEYYSPFSSSKTYVEHYDTPKEMQESLSAREITSFEILTNNLVEIYKGATPLTEPQDLSPGVYDHSCGDGSRPERLSPMKLRDDVYIDILDNLEGIETTVADFEKNKGIYQNSGSIYKLGILLFGPPGCHAAGTKVLMYDGSLKNVEDVVVGDLLMGPDSKPRKVLELAGGRETMVKIKPVKGEEFVVNINHILHLTPSGDDLLTQTPINMSVLDYLKQNANFRNRYKLTRTSVNFDKKELPIPAYILGSWLGDGTSVKPEITSMDNSIVEEWRNYARTIGAEILEAGNGSKAGRFSITTFTKKGQQPKGRNLFLKFLQDMNLIGNKHIPQIYLTSSFEDRNELLAGLIDTDGHYSCGGYEITQKSNVLAEQIVFLARSLGYAAYSKKCNKSTQDGVWGEYNRIFISGELSSVPVRLERKKASTREQIKSVLRTGFEVEILGVDNYYGFTLNKDHLYLTSDFTIHHNTGKSSWTRKFIKSRKDAIVVFLDQVPSRSFLEKLESSTKDILKVFVFEEAVSLLEDSSDIREMLDFLDGSKTVSNAIYFLSTNYPDAIPENVIRNGRIDTFAYVDYPGESARQKLINLYLNRDGTSEEVKITDKMPIVDIREMCFLHKKTNKSFSDCVKIIEEKHKMIKKHFGRTKEIRLT
jgi:hypothetical protein